MSKVRQIKVMKLLF